LVGALLATIVASQAASPSTAATGKRPNIVIILGDDLGFSDMGAFGGEIMTPNLDALAKAGVRCTQFLHSRQLFPHASMLLSGVDTHRNGLGNMDEWTAPNQMGKPGYEGYLNDRVATLPQLLKDAGYHNLHGRQMAHGQGPHQSLPHAGSSAISRCWTARAAIGTWRISTATTRSPRLPRMAVT